MIFLQSRCGKLRLSPDAVEDIATLLTYYRLAFAITAKAQAEISDGSDRCNAKAISEHYKKMDAALAFVASNLQQEYDVFKMTIAHQEVIKRISANRSKRARQLSLTPKEFVHVLTRLAECPDTGDGPRSSELTPGNPVAEQPEHDNPACPGESETVVTSDNPRRHRTRQKVD